MKIVELLGLLEAEYPPFWTPEEETANQITRISGNDDAVHFWVQEDGTFGHIPLYGVHEDAAYSVFADDDDEDSESINFNLVAMQHGWIRATASGNGREFNFDFMPSHVSLEARKAALNLLRRSPVQQVAIDTVDERGRAM